MKTIFLFLILLSVLSCANDRWTYYRLAIFFDSIPSYEEWSTGQKPLTIKKPETVKIKKEEDKIYPHPPWAADKCNLCHTNDFSMATKAKEPQLCFTCHKDKQRLVESFYVGLPAAKDENGAELKVHKALLFTQLGSCTFRCHVFPPHFSKFPKLLQGKVEDVCVSCHAAPQEPFDMRGQNCVECHDPHGSVNDKLLKS